MPDEYAMTMYTPDTSQTLTIFSVHDSTIVLQLEVHGEKHYADSESIFVHPQDIEVARDACIQETRERWERNAALEASSP